MSEEKAILKRCGVKLLSFAILSILILPVLSSMAMAAVTDDSGCAGTCIDTTKQKCSVSTQSGLCTGAATRLCCTGTVTASASGSGSSGGVEIPNPLKTKSIPDLIDRIVNYVIGIATIVFPLIIIYGAFQFLTTGGDMEKVTAARKTITYAIIGYVLIWMSKGITMIVAEFLGAK